MRRSWFAVLLLCLFVSACGGGGGDDGGTTPPPGGSTPGDFTLGTTTANFTAPQGGNTPASISIPMTITGSNVAAVGAAYVGGATQPAWLGINMAGSGSSYSVLISINQTNLSPGQYNSTFSVGTADSNGTILRSQAITVTYTVTAGTGGTNQGDFTLGATTATFSAQQGSSSLATTSIPVTITGSNVGAVRTTSAAGQSQPTWLGHSVFPSGTSYGVLITVNPAGLGVGQYAGTIVVFTEGPGGISLRSQTISVTYTISASPPPPPPPPADPNAGNFTLGTTSASFSALSGVAAPSPVNIPLTITGSGVAAVASSFAGPTPAWLRVTPTGSGNSRNIALSIVGSGTPAGSYTSTVVLHTLDSSGAVLKSQPITVSYTLLARISVGSTSYLRMFVYGDTRITETVPLAVTAPNRSWSATSDAPWLQVPGGAQTGSGTLNAVVNAAALAPGQYSGTVTLTGSTFAQDTVAISFSVDVSAPRLTVQQSEIVIGGEDGLSNTAQTLNFSLSSGNATHPFTISATTDSGGSWLTASAPSGNVGPSGTSVQISAARGSLPGATYTGELTVSVTVGTLTLTELVPVTYNVEAHRLVLGAVGVGLSSSPAPARSVLTRDVKVFSSLGRTNTPWTATDDQSWLTVTPSGTTGGTLTLTADPSGLAADQTHFATVTVTSSDTFVENTETIRVGFHINSAAPTTGSLTFTSINVIASPVEPLVFIHNGGNVITAYNVYTRAVVRTFNSVIAGASYMAMSGDGRSLFVYDRTNIRVTELNATTGDFVRHYLSSFDGGTPYGGGIAFVRPAAHPTLITPGGRVYDTTSGAEYGPEPFHAARFSVSLAASEDSTRVVTDFGSVYSIDRTALAGGRFRSALDFGASTAQGRAGQACISEDKQFVYTASGYPYNFPGTTMQAPHQVARILPGTNYPIGVLCLWNGVIVGSIVTGIGPNDIFIHDGVTGQQIGVADSSSWSGNHNLVHGGVVASADGTRLITLGAATWSGTSGDRSQETRFQALPGPL